jgi:hypothetical protein
LLSPSRLSSKIDIESYTNHDHNNSSNDSTNKELHYIFFPTGVLDLNLKMILMMMEIIV